MTKPFVPAGAKSFFDELESGRLGFNKWGLPNGHVHRIKEINDEIAECESLLLRNPQDASRLNESIWILQMNRKLTEEEFSRTIRLRDDIRMSEAYSFLTHELEEEQQWHCFLGAALCTNEDYTLERQALVEAKDLASNIATKATELADLISQHANTSPHEFPLELFSLRHLLHKLPYSDEDWNSSKWMELRRFILGHDFNPKKSHSDFLEMGEDIEAFAARDNNPNRSIRFENGYWTVSPIFTEDLEGAWLTAPTPSKLLRTLAASARDFQPTLEGWLDAATSSRKSVHKTAYIRAFGYYLSVLGKIPLSRNIMKAMAIVVTVVLNQENLVVSYDDVRKALSSLTNQS